MYCSDEIWVLYGLIGFFSTLSVYNGQRLFKTTKTTKTPWLAWVSENRIALWVLTIVSGALATYLVYAVWFGAYQRPSALILIAISAVVSFFYVRRIAGKNLREIPTLKIHLIASIWVAVLIVFPYINEGRTSGWMWPAIAHYFYVIAVTIPFDIRDLKHDLPGQKTIPQMIGVNASRILSVFLLIVFSVIMFYTNNALWYNPLFYLSVFVQLFLVLFMNEKRSDLYCVGAIDGAIGLLGFSYLFASM